ncbi:heparinase [Devosia pacifica]|uniref:Heparinase n=1 Tax=Devosia pacifica TaxID=1335967 RepID=A0A918VTK9_9HYPH|nr:heparinase II/III family protein [Devosia pacifica]GHA24211.1 heparinase [Devosia pacifica]
MLRKFGHRWRGRGLRILDGIVTTPLVRWTWAGLAEDTFVADLIEFRPSDPEAVRDMMAGRYLLGTRLVDTHGLSPFAVEVENEEWEADLHAFGWLRHFRDVRDPALRAFARTLVLDWIGHEGQYDSFTWSAAITGQRVLNWLRHLELLLSTATPDQATAIKRSLGTQVQSLRRRRPFLTDPTDQLMAAAALVGAARCDRDESVEEVDRRVERLNGVLREQIDDTGMHLSRSPARQLQVLVEISSLRRSLSGDRTDPRVELAEIVERMHGCLAALTLGTGEPVYANGTGQLAHDTLIALQSSTAPRVRGSGVFGGYAVLRDGPASLVADSGRVPPPGFGETAHSGALAFEFSHGPELVIGNCGPAPQGVPVDPEAFRQGLAHSGVTINSEDAYPITARGPYAGQPQLDGNQPTVSIDIGENLAVLATDAYAERFGVTLERKLTLINEGTTLVGQDRMIGSGRARAHGELAVRFHLAPGTVVRRGSSDGMVRLILASGISWTLLWEGASLHEDDSLRQSASRGFHRTRQIILEAPVVPDGEIAWVLTREQ